MKYHRRFFLFALVVAPLIGGGVSVWQVKRQYARNRQLVAALAHNDTKQALSLVQTGADPNTPFDTFAAPSFLLLLRQFLSHKSSDDDKPTAFLIVCGATIHMPGKYDSRLIPSPSVANLAREMLVHGADINARTEHNSTALLLAATWKNADVAELLVEQGADVNTPSATRRTPLMQAVRNNMPDLVRLLLTRGASVNSQDALGETALHRAVGWNEDQNNLRQLLAYGANPNQPDKQGYTPLMLAQMKKRPDLVALLRQIRK